MQKIKDFFELKGRYRFEVGDITALLYTVCAIGCMLGYNMTVLFTIAATVSIAVCWQAKRINLVVLNLAFWVMNVYNLVTMFLA